jgi:hypothetical protein
MCLLAVGSTTLLISSPGHTEWGYCSCMSGINFDFTPTQGNPWSGSGRGCYNTWAATYAGCALFCYQNSPYPTWNKDWNYPQGGFGNATYAITRGMYWRPQSEPYPGQSCATWCSQDPKLYCLFVYWDSSVNWKKKTQTVGGPFTKPNRSKPPTNTPLKNLSPTNKMPQTNRKFQQKSLNQQPPKKGADHPQ